MVRLAERVSGRVLAVVLFVSLVACGIGIGFLFVDSERSDETNMAQDVRITTAETDVAALALSLAQANERLAANGATPVPVPEVETGPPGLQGVPGLQGLNGVDGTDGLAGINGTDGEDGATGRRGRTGQAGADGAAGADGVDGQDGTTGLPGTPGATGETGPQGPAGETGPAGERGPAGESAFPFSFAFTVPGALGSTTYSVACGSDGCTVTES